MVTARMAREGNDLVPDMDGRQRQTVFGLAVAMIAALAAPAFGQAATLLQLLCLGAILAMRWREFPALLPAALPLLLLPLFAAASFMWSDVPDISLRYGVQLIATVIMGLVLGRLLSLRDLVLAVFIGTTIACLIGLASRRMGVSDGGMVMIGLSGSKNQMGYIALFWLSAALCVAGSGAYRPLARILASLAVIPASFLLVQADSATAIVSMAVLLGLLAMLAVASFLGRGGRLFALLAAALLTVPVVVGLPEIERQSDVLRTDVLQKDARLTGRTLLWESADVLIAQSPVIGHGYKAIWLGPKGKGLLARNHQRDGRAFHFHDTFREIMADLGAVGLVLFLLPLAYAALRAVLLLIAEVDAQRAFAFATLATIILRIRTELVLGPFMIDTALLYAVVAALAVIPLAEATTDARPALFRMRKTRNARSSLRPQRNPA
ncbi:MAG: hypothetical protein CFE32_17700 [Alphaproteobacteria bacterium PA3]|nr:MAG: hypothetical protein CFE32_17700 [Alphaproteobacteria bacterium PA3]